MPEHPAYYYWTSLCRLAWANAKNDYEALQYAPTLEQLIARGTQLNRDYEGGGFDRLAGIFYANLPDFNPFGPVRDVARASRHFLASINHRTPYVEPKDFSWREDEKEDRRTVLFNVLLLRDKSVFGRRGRQSHTCV